MSIFETVAKKTNFCIGIGFVSLISVVIVSTMGLAMDYYMMHANHIELFWSCVVLAATWVPVILFIQFSLLGLIRPLTLKSFRPLNKYVIGLDLAPGITINQLNETIESLKGFTVRFALLSFLSAAIGMSLFIINPIIKHYEFIYIMSQIVIGSLVIVVYTISSFMVSVGKIELVRRKSYHILADYKKQQRDKEDLKRRRR